MTPLLSLCPPSYTILAPKQMKALPDDKDATEKCLEVIELEHEKYRIGHTKARLCAHLYSPSALPSMLCPLPGDLVEFQGLASGGVYVFS